MISLLSDSQWQGAQLKGLLASRAIPHADRIAISGPDIVVSARAAQSLSLLFFELASQANDGCRGRQAPHIAVHWEVTGKEPDELFHLKWEEFNASAATRREDSDFGLILLDRVAPGSARRHVEALLHRCKLRLRTLRADGTVVDKTETDRTGQIVRTAAARSSLEEPRRRRGTNASRPHYRIIHMRRLTMGRYMLLWLIGVPLPILLLIWAFGGLN